MKRRAFTLSALSLLGAQLAGTRDAASAAGDALNVGVGPSAPASAIVYAARELGYYAAANIQTAMRFVPGAPAALDAMTKGTIDLCSIAPAALATSTGTGARAQIVAMFAPPRPVGWYIMVPPGSPIRTLADLDGKRVGVTQAGSHGDVFVQEAAKLARLSIATSPLAGGVLAGLLAKKVDAAIFSPPASYRAFLSGDLREVAHLETELPPSVPEGMCASRDLIENRPNVLRRWLLATAKAVAYMQANELWTEKFLAAYLDESDDASISMMYRDFIMKIDSTGEMHADWKRTALDLPAHGANAALISGLFSTAFVPIGTRRL